MALKVTKKPLFEFRGQVSATKRTIFEFRGSKIKEIRPAVERNGQSRSAHRTAPGVAAGVDTSKVTWVTFFALGFATYCQPPIGHIFVFTFMNRARDNYKNIPTRARARHRAHSRLRGVFNIWRGVTYILRGIIRWYYAGGGDYI